MWFDKFVISVMCVIVIVCSWFEILCLLQGLFRWVLCVVFV